MRFVKLFRPIALLSASLLTSTACALSHETQVTLKFTAPTIDTDGNPLPNNEILFYRINYGDSADPDLGFEAYKSFENPGTSVVEYRTLVVNDRIPDWDQICTMVTSVRDDGAGGQIESGPSNVVCRDLEPAEPKAVAAPIDDFDGEVSGEFFPWDMRLTWTAPDTRIDGSTLPLDQISHYKVYYTEFADDPVVESQNKKLINPGVPNVLWRFTVTDAAVADWTSICGRVKTTAFITHTETQQSLESNITCHVFSEPPEPPTAPGTIIDLEAEVVNIKAGTVNIITSP